MDYPTFAAVKCNTQLLMYASAANVGDVYIRTVAVQCLRSPSAYNLYSWRSLFTQGRGRRISANFAGKVPKDSPYRGGTSLSATLGFSDRHGPTEGENAMNMGTQPYALAREEGQTVWFLGTLLIVKATGEQTGGAFGLRSEEHTSELQSRQYLVCRLLLEKKNKPQRRKQDEHPAGGQQGAKAHAPGANGGDRGKMGGEQT